MVKPNDCTQEARRPMVMPRGIESGLSEDMTPGKEVGGNHQNSII